VRDSSAALAFYAEALGAQELLQMSQVSGLRLRDAGCGMRDTRERVLSLGLSPLYPHLASRITPGPRPCLTRALESQELLQVSDLRWNRRLVQREPLKAAIAPVRFQSARPNNPNGIVSHSPGLA